MAYVDPFEGGSKTSAVSFKDARPGDSITMLITKLPELVQSRDFETGQPAVWDDGNPKMSAVVTGTVDGEERAVWASKPSAMFAAVAEAQRVAGAKLAPGGTLTITYAGDKPNEKNPRLNAAKQYTATYVPADAFGGTASTASGPAELAARLGNLTANF